MQMRETPVALMPALRAIMTLFESTLLNMCAWRYCRRSREVRLEMLEDDDLSGAFLGPGASSHRVLESSEMNSAHRARIYLGNRDCRYWIARVACG